MNDDQSRGRDYNEAFLAWARRLNIRPSEFARRTGYSYIHAYNLLRGATSVTTETLGRIAVGYGADVLEGLLKEEQGKE